ncbi:DUF5916 domain-containing protein [Pelomonas sp. SE-A7]|uniref:carbohydrate binding family 9 domain-containing protein n=1 Tax=Pelomonas sp. SE-A7 TaxID=3054953 RepID=UPI00259D1068|nr:DUF5916 domain-containing protein [Pelomonas sp. SE-A7]MDM4767132.1 DUF5916 domain-containing protein [Pelomonas sp. SE-A7]
MLKKPLATALLAGLSGFALAGEHAAASLRALRLSGAATLQIDGRLDEPHWRQAPVYDKFSQFLPEDKRAARWRTTVQVIADEHALTFAIRAYDPEPQRIRAPLSRRDQVGLDQDFVAVYLDPVGQRRAAQFVRIGAAGSITDGVFNAADDNDDTAPDFDVQVAVQRLDDGYSLELRWPLAELRFPHADGAPWRVMVVRGIPRDEAVLDVSSPRLSKDALSFIAEMQLLEGLGDLVEQVRERSFIKLRPELTLRREAGRSQSSLGAELKWRPRADWVIDATLNPDFSQIESDEPQLAGNTRFALFQPEKRPFFLESTDVLGQTQPDDSGLAQGLAAFYSRTVSDPDWGLRATWRGAAAEGLALSLRDAGGGRVLRPSAYATAEHAQPAGSQASFIRGRAQWGAANLGLLGSSRDYGNGARNQVLGADFGWALDDSNQLRGHWLASDNTVSFDTQDRIQTSPIERGHKLWLAWRHRSEAWSNGLHLEEISPRFVNDNGFVPQAGIRRALVMLNRRLGAGSLGSLPVFEAEAQLRLEQTETLADGALQPGGELVQRRLEPGFWFSTLRNTGLWGHLALGQQRSRTGGPLHSPRTLNLGLESNPAPWFTHLALELEWGRRLDVEADRLGNGLATNVQAKLRFGLPRGLWLELEQRLGQSQVRNPQGQRAYDERNAQLLAVLHVDARDSLRWIEQRGHSRRQAEALLAGQESHSRSQSLVFQRRMGHGKLLGLGASLVRPETGQPLQRQLFAKLSWAWGG